MRRIQPSSDEVRTQQAHAERVNINDIIARWRDGTPLPESHRDPLYGDFSNADGYHAAANAVRQAGVEFMRLPAELRAHVNNDVGTFLSACQDEERLQELIDLGLDGYLAPPGIELPGHPEVVAREAAEKAEQQKIDRDAALLHAASKLDAAEGS